MKNLPRLSTHFWIFLFCANISNTVILWTDPMWIFCFLLIYGFLLALVVSPFFERLAKILNTTTSSIYLFRRQRIKQLILRAHTHLHWFTFITGHTCKQYNIHNTTGPKPFTLEIFFFQTLLWLPNCPIVCTRRHHFSGSDSILSLTLSLFNFSFYLSRFDSFDFS